MFFCENVENPPFFNPNAGSFTQKGHRIGIVSDSDKLYTPKREEPQNENITIYGIPPQNVGVIHVLRTM